MAKNKNLASAPTEDIASAYSEFVNSLDRWLHLVVERNPSEKYLIEQTVNSARRNIQSNVNYYQERAMTSEKEGDYSSAERYKLIAKVYDELCKN